MPASPGDRKLFVVKIQVQELGKIYLEAPKGLRVVFYAKFTFLRSNRKAKHIKFYFRVRYPNSEKGKLLGPKVCMGITNSLFLYQF